MVLSSQGIRSDGRRMMSSDGRRIRRRGVKLVALLLLVAVAGWIGWKFLGTHSDSPQLEVRNDNVASKTQVSQGMPSENRMVQVEAANSVPLQPHSVIGDSDAQLKQVIEPSAKQIAAQNSSPNQPAANMTPADSASVNAALQSAIAHMESDPVLARAELTRLLEGSAMDAGNRLKGYEAINKVNAVLTFSDRILANDSFSQQYIVKDGDSLSNIRRALKLDCEWRFLQRINNMKSERNIRSGQTLKAPTEAFHGEVRKSEFRFNIFEGEGPQRVMVASYPIALGEFNSTPTGAFSIRPRSKLIDPEWRNPRTGQHFASNDPANPIGERWIGLKGIEPHNKNFEGYGIHGTTDLSSIGQQASMGCVRMLPQDVEVVYELLTEPNSVVTIAP